MKYRVLFQTCPIWKPGEKDVDAEPRRIRQEDAPPSERYPDDYTGRVISVIPDGSRLSADDVRDASRMAVTLDLTDVEVTAFRNRTAKIGSDLLPTPVDFDDRWGAVAETLRANIVDPLSAESQEPDSDIEAKRFWELATLSRRMLPATEVHTGAGLYEVGPGKTYSTIQSALDQLWSDQGSAAFTASQYIRVFADTYAELVTPNASFNPREDLSYGLIIEGDPNDSRDNIIVAPSGTLYSFNINCDHCMLRHMKVAGAVTNISGQIFSSTGLSAIQIHDCLVETTASRRAVTTLSGDTQAKDCHFTQSGTGAAALRLARTGALLRCRIEGPGKASTSSAAIEFQLLDHMLLMQGCAISGFEIGLDTQGHASWCFENCTIYNCTEAISISRPIGNCYQFTNIIVSECNVVFEMNSWPEETTTVLGPQMVLRNNCYYSYTSFATSQGTPKTYAEFTAFNGVDASDDLDQTDPEMTDPANGDYSLQDGSPCENAGHGSGATEDYLGTAFDPATPDIGAWSSGVLPPPGPPSIPDIPEITSIANDGNGTSATVSVTTESGSKVFILARQRNSIEPWTTRGSRTDSGDVVATGFTNNTNYECIAIATFGTLVSDNPSLPSIPVGVFVTDSTGFYSDVRQALYDWVDGELGINTIWYQPNAPQRSKPYATINMGPTQNPRWDYKSPPDAVNGVSAIRGDRDFTVEIQIQGRRLPNNENEALTLAEQLSTSLQKDSIVALFAAAEFAYVDRVALTDLSGIGGTEFEARVSLELLFRMGHEDTDTVGVIETVEAVDGTFE